MTIDQSMRVNAGYAWAGCDFNVYARPTIPSHSFMTSRQAMQMASYAARGRTVGNGNIVDRAAPGALKFTDGMLPRSIRHDASMRLRRTHARLNTVQLVC